MPVIHHPLLRRELEVSEIAAEILTTNPRAPWRRGPLKKIATPKPTAETTTSPEGDPDPLTEED